MVLSAGSFDSRLEMKKLQRKQKKKEKLVIVLWEV